MEKGYVCYPVRETKTVPVTYAPSKDVFWNKHRQYEHTDRPFVAESTYEELKQHDNYDPYFKRVQKSYDSVRNSWRNDDYYENLKLRDQLDQYIESTKLKQQQLDENLKYKKFVKNYEDKYLWSRRKKECEEKYGNIFEVTAKSVLGRYRQTNAIFDFDSKDN